MSFVSKFLLLGACAGLSQFASAQTAARAAVLSQQIDPV